MKRHFRNPGWIVTAMTVSVAAFALSGCNSDQVATNSSSQQGPAWSLQYKASCGTDADAASCVGAYGFQINADGTFDVGPGPQGQHVHGKLDADDFKSVTDATINIVDGTAPARAEACNQDYSAYTDSTVTLVKESQKSEVLRKAGADLCSTRLDEDSSVSLQDLMVQLAQKYYPTPFPDACLEAAQAVEALYPALQTCHVDSDCGYLSEDFSPIAKDSDSQVYTDNCSVVTPLAAANTAAVQASLTKLQAALQNAQQVCGDRIARENCEGVQSFDSSAAPAVCQQGVCRVNPSLTATPNAIR